MADRCVYLLPFFGGSGLADTCCVMESLEELYLRIAKLRRDAEHSGEEKSLGYSARKVHSC